MKCNKCFYMTLDEFDAQRGEPNSVICIGYVKGFQLVKKGLYVEVQMVKVCKR